MTERQIWLNGRNKVATTANGVWTPDASANYNLTTDLASMAASIDTALERRANSYKGTQAQRVAFTAAPEGSIWVDTNGDQQLWVRRGTGWFVVGDLSGYARYNTSGGVNGQWIETGTDVGDTYASFRVKRGASVVSVGNTKISGAPAVELVIQSGEAVASHYFSTSGANYMKTGTVVRPVPFATASGTLTVPVTANTVSTTSVTFPSGRFTKAPYVFTNVRTSTPQMVSVIAGDNSTAGFNIYAHRTASSNLNIQWFAIQLEP